MQGNRAEVAALLEKIRASINIIEVVGEHVVLRKSGANHIGLCPFHSERTPSFSVSETKGLFHCYGCKKGGDLVTFVMEILGIGFIEAIEELAEKGRIPLTGGLGGRRDGEDGAHQESHPRERKAEQKKALAYKLNRFAAAFFHRTLNDYQPASHYLSRRGISTEFRDGYYLGATRDLWDELAQHFIETKAPLDLAVEVGLIKPSQKQSSQRGSHTGYFDLLRNRVIFPILNMRGKVAGFGARAVGEDHPKYLNSPESLIFQKSKLAYGLFQAQKFIREQDELILVEGYFDVLSMHALGFKNVVATCGTALSSDHLAQFRRLASRIIVLFDGDAAGIEATERAMEIGLENGVVLFGANLPSGMDPADLYFDGERRQADAKEQITDILAKAKALLDSRIVEAFQGSGASAVAGEQSPEDRVLALKKVGAWLGKFNDSVGREVRMQWLEKKFGVNRALIERTMGKTTLAPPARQAVNPVRERVQQDRTTGEVLTTSDRMMITGLISEPQFLEIFRNTAFRLPPGVSLSDLLDYRPARLWIQEIMQVGFENVGTKPEQMILGILDPGLRSLVSEAMFSEVIPSKLQFNLEDYKGALRQKLRKAWSRFSLQIKKAITQAETEKNIEIHASLMEEYLDVQRKIKELVNFYDEA